MELSLIRNFSIIAHIDHGKSTLADRILQLTNTVSDRDMQEQFLDSMDIEREKGVTIKASVVRMTYNSASGEQYQYNLIDTPGHVDFSYEVSRALVACEGAVLVVDATQGIEAQTLANLYMAIEADLDIIPVVNKIDVSAARVDDVSNELAELLGVRQEDVIAISAKMGTNIDAVLEAILVQVRPPTGNSEAPAKALILDSHYDAYKGVIAYVRVCDGSIRGADKLRLMAPGLEFEPVEIGTFLPNMDVVEMLSVGEVGYVATGLKNVRECRVGDTLTTATNPASESMPGYQAAKPMVFAGLYPVDGDQYPLLKDGLQKLQLNDAALVYEPEKSHALNFGFRCGFLGLFHMEIVQERLEREYDIDLIATAPSVEYEIEKGDGEVMRIKSPAEMAALPQIAEVREPWMRIQVMSPERYFGPIMELVIKRRGKTVEQQYMAGKRVMLIYDIPLAELIVDFYDRLKSLSRGYASLDYSFRNYRAGDLVALNILVNEQPVDALTLIVQRDDAYNKGRQIVSKLKELVPRQLFPVPVQASVGGRIIARASIRAMRKDVLAKCYGGDVTRKRKLLGKQKSGKRRMKTVGNVDVPQDAFMAILKLGSD